MSDRAYFSRYNERRRRAVSLLIAENRDRYRELLRWAAADTPTVTAERRDVLFRETAPRRTT